MGSEERKLSGMIAPVKQSCGCIHNKLTGHSLFVCMTHVQATESVNNHFRIRDEEGVLHLIPGPPPWPELAKATPEAAQAQLDAICALVRVSMPHAVKQAFVGQLSDLRNMVKEPAQRDSFSRGVWAGWDSLLTELISRLQG